jgi:hypothetical protein
MLSSPLPCHLVRLMPKYPPQHPILAHFKLSTANQNLQQNIQVMWNVAEGWEAYRFLTKMLLKILLFCNAALYQLIKSISQVPQEWTTWLLILISRRSAILQKI